jgi:hypothetical protein
MSTRAALFEERMLALGAAGGQRLSIWGAGRDGKSFFKGLSARGRACVALWIDIDPGKVGSVFPQHQRQQQQQPGGGVNKRQKLLASAAPAPLPPQSARAGGSGSQAEAEAEEAALRAWELQESSRPRPIVHFSAVPAELGTVVVCVALDTGGEQLRANIAAASAASVAAGGKPLEEGSNLWFMC